MTARFLGPTLAIAALAVALAAAPLAGQDRFARPLPRYQFTVQKDVMVPMRDGVNLAADLYLPKDAGGRFPVIVMRTPYNKDTYRGSIGPAEFFAGQGFGVVAEDVRGKWHSEGDYRIQSHDRDDGYDTIDWAASQPWSTGKIGTYGCSYLGENQILLAGARHPKHLAAVPQAAAGGLGSAGGYWSGFGAYAQGVFLTSAVGWFLGAGVKDRNPAPPDSFDFGELLRSKPAIEMIRRIKGPRTDFEDYLSHRPGDAYWLTQGYATDTTRFDVPAIHVNSWLDYGAEQTLFLFNLFRTNAVSARARENQYAIISPTGHCDSEAAGEHTMVGDRDVGDARYGYWQIYLNWFDYWLRGVGTGIRSMPKVHYYVIGANEWRTANTWPLPDMRPVPFYLSSRRGANTNGGDGLLARTPPAVQGNDTLTFDPDNPFPSRGGTICCTGNPKDLPGIFDQADLETRSDLLVYSTPPLATSLTIAGPVRADLYISSDAKDTDFTTKLIDVDPDGKAWNVVDGVARVRYRNGLTSPALMEPGQVYQIEVNIKSIAYQFKVGHRVRLYLSSSNFPQWERNSNTGGNIFDETTYVVAHNAVHFGPRRPSALILPVVPK